MFCLLFFSFIVDHRNWSYYNNKKAKGKIWSQSTEGGPGSWGWHFYISPGTVKPYQYEDDEDQVNFYTIRNDS
jgi:hypothetical protein